MKPPPRICPLLRALEVLMKETARYASKTPPRFLRRRQYYTIKQIFFKRKSLPNCLCRPTREGKSRAGETAEERWDEEEQVREEEK